MNTIHEYLDNTETAVRIIINGINAYVGLLNDNRPPVFIAWGDDDDRINRDKERWRNENKVDIDRAIKAQNIFVAESFAMATLCGALLQIAYQGIKGHSSNNTVPSTLGYYIKDTATNAKFSVGREIRGVPAGLIVYAGRNQHAHYDDGECREPTLTIFAQLANIPSLNTPGKYYTDGCFDLHSDNMVSYASNITALLGWRNYEAYSRDLIAMLA